MTSKSVELPDEIYERLTHLSKIHNASLEDTLAKLIRDADESLTPIEPQLSPDSLIAEKVLHMMAEGVIVYDEAGNIIFANESSERILGLSADRMTSQTPLEPDWTLIREDGTPLAEVDYPAQTTLRTHESLSSVVLGISRAESSPVWISVDTQSVMLDDKQRIVIASFSDITRQKEIEASLLAEQARMRAILESIPGTIITLNEQFEVIDIYSQIAVEEGLNFKQFIHKPLEHFLSAALVQEAKTAVKAVYETGQQSYYRMQSDSGRWYDIRVSPVVQANKITAATITSIEITEQVKAEEALRESEAYIRAVLQSTPGSIITVDRDLNILSMYSAPGQVQGLNMDDYIGQNLLKIVPEDSIEITRERIKQVFETGENKSYEAMALSGLWYTVHVAPVKNTHNHEVSAVTLVSLNIHALKQAEDALRQSQANLVAILQSMPGAMYTIGRDGRILEVHSWMWKTQRRDPKDLHVEYFWELTPDDDAKHRLSEHIDNAFITRTLTISEMRGQDMRWYDVRSAPIINGDEVTGVIFIALDIHDRKMLEQKALDVALEKERVRVLSSFISDASHEFRTPLAAMNTSLYLLERDRDESKRANRMAQIQRQIFSLTALVNDLLTISRLDNNFQFKTYGVQLNDLLPQILASYTEHLEEKQIRLSFEVKTAYLEVVANGDELSLALKKIIDNALRFTPEGGDIIVRSYLEDEFAVIEVQDSGKGMSEEELERASERFYRSDYSHTTRGFGLGLPIAIRIIEAHCGHLILQSQPSKGTTVIVRVPRLGCLNSGD